jgi:hypothetical protein
MFWTAFAPFLRPDLWPKQDMLEIEANTPIEAADPLGSYQTSAVDRCIVTESRVEPGVQPSLHAESPADTSSHLTEDSMILGSRHR